MMYRVAGLGNGVFNLACKFYCSVNFFFCVPKKHYFLIAKIKLCIFYFSESIIYLILIIRLN